jgi:hypothetical protein
MPQIVWAGQQSLNLMAKAHEGDDLFDQHLHQPSRKAM